MLDATGDLPGWLRSNGEALQFALFAGLFLLLGVAERLVPRRGPTRRRARWPANLGLTLLALIELSILPALVPLSFIAAADWAGQHGWGLLQALALPAAPALVATLLLRGFISWLTHFLMHKTPALWRVHRVHHMDTELDVTTTVRFHPAEFLINLPIGVALVVAFGLSPWALVLYELLDVAVTLFSLANLRLPQLLDRALRRVIVTPDLHRIHHSSWQPETDSNFSAVFPVWDMLLGTYRGSPRDGHEAMEIGLAEARAPRVDRLLWLLASPLHSDLAAPGGHRSQFAHPRGPVGRLVGRLMASKNRFMNELAARQLDAGPEDRILEIGHGPGVAIELLARQVTHGLVAGVDVSPTMHAQASRRNRSAIRAGRVELAVAPAAALPYPDASFDKVFEINSYHHWPDPDAALAEIHRVLRPSGQLVLCLRMAHPTRTRLVAPGHSAASVDEAERALVRAGFHTVTRESFRLVRGVTCLRGER